MVRIKGRKALSYFIRIKSVTLGPEAEYHIAEDSSASFSDLLDVSPQEKSYKEDLNGKTEV